VGTNRPSRTAVKIARFMLLLDAVPRLEPVLPAGAAETAEAILRASGAVRLRDIGMMRSPRTVRFYEAIEKLLGQGQLLWFGLRKRWLAEAVEQSIAEGARQVLVLGSGFDPLAVMAARRHPEVLCVEADAPATANPKRAGIEGAGLACPNHVILASDLAASPLEEVLRPTGWRAGIRSIVVAEGLLMYLRPPDVLRLFSQVLHATSPGSRLAFTSMDADEDNRPRLFFNAGLLNRFIQSALRAAGEPLRWGISPASLPAFLSAAGYRPMEQPAPPDLRARFLDPIGLHEEPLAPYEHLCLAEVLAATPRP
jgi:methyltransferase (TIGR00027 family)